MISFVGQAILLDIEGVVSSPAFVHDALHTYARHEMTGFLQNHWDEPAVAAACHQIARDAAAPSFEQWCGGAISPDVCMVKVRNEVLRLLDAGTETPGLQDLLGLVWRLGFRKGVLTAPVFPDVAPRLGTWRTAGLRLATFSSLTAGAQRAFFSQATAGNVNSCFTSHFDASIGGKLDPSSYANIASRMEVPAGEILYISGIAAELDAAAEAGINTGLMLRPSHPAVPTITTHPVISSFEEIAVQLSPALLSLPLSSEPIGSRPAA